MNLDDIKKLHQKKYRQQFGHYLVEGEHLVLELQKVVGKHNAYQANTIQLLVTDKYRDWQSPFRTQLVSEKQMSRLSDTKSPQGIVACVPLPTTTEEKPSASVRHIYLHEIQDPGNLGTILRTLAWFGGFKLLLSQGSVDPFNAKVVRSSMGGIFHVPMALDVSLDALSAQFKQFAYLDMSGDSIKSSHFTEYPCYLFGNEARGVPRTLLQALNTTAFTIPGSGAIESLNVASALNICAFELALT